MQKFGSIVLIEIDVVENRNENWDNYRTKYKSWEKEAELAAQKDEPPPPEPSAPAFDVGDPEPSHTMFQKGNIEAITQDIAASFGTLQSNRCWSGSNIATVIDEETAKSACGIDTTCSGVCCKLN